MPAARRPVRAPAAAALVLAACAHVPTTKEKDAAEIHFDLGVGAMKQNRAADAMREFLDAVKLWPSFPEPHNALGLLYHWSFRRLDDAERELRTAVELRPGYSEAWNNLGVLLTDRGDRKGARAAFEKALSDTLYPTPWIAQTNLGWLLFEDGARDEGERLVRAATVSRPDYCMAHRQLARILEAKGAALPAQESWDRFGAACPDEPEALLLEGTKRLRDGATDEARRALERCVARADGRAPAEECRALLARLPPAAPVPPAAPPPRDEAGSAVRGAHDLEPGR